MYTLIINLLIISEFLEDCNMRQFRFVIFMVCVIFSLGVKYSFAYTPAGDDGYNPLDSMYIYTVGEFGSTQKQDTFSFNETPYLYMHLPDEGYSVTVSFWLSPTSNVFYENTGISTAKDMWIQPSLWESHKAVGTWQVNAGALYSSGVGYTAHTSFNVTPEPLAVVLFLVGGAPVAVGILKRRRFSV